MKFTFQPRTKHIGWLHLNDSPAGFCQLHTNGYKSKGPDPELVKACALIKAAPEVLAALEALLLEVDEMTKRVGWSGYGARDAARQLIAEIRQP